MGGRDESYYYVYSCDLNQRVKIRIGSLEGNVPEKDFEELLNDPIAPFRREQLVLISAEVYCDGVSVALPVHTQPIPGKIYKKRSVGVMVVTFSEFTPRLSTLTIFF